MTATIHTHTPAFTPMIRAVTATLLTLILAGCGLQAEEVHTPPPPQVDVADVLARNFIGWNEYTGRVSAIDSVQLRPRVGGYIEKVLFTEGQEVAKGDVLFEIDARSYRASFDQAQAEVARARSQAELTRSEVERAQRLAQSRAIANEVLDQRQAAADQAQAQVRAAEARLASARLDLEFTRVRAPIAGRAGRALVTAGNLADPNSSVLTTLVSLDPVHVYFEVDEQAFLRFRNSNSADGDQTGAAVQVGLADDSGFPHAGTLDFVDNQLDGSTGTIRARAVLDNAERRFTPGLYARVRLMERKHRTALLIDDRAILTDQDRKYVYVIDDQGAAQRRDIVTGRSFDGLRVIESGLDVGDRIVVNGIQRIFFPGMPVDPQPVPMQGTELAQNTP